jgi:hypothetical protein
MSDEEKRSRGKWLSRVVAALIVFASYESAHYATVEDVWALGADRVCRHYHQHMIRDKPMPLWVEVTFEPAQWIDSVPLMIRNHPWHSF